jgi:hypothetical protein
MRKIRSGGHPVPLEVGNPVWGEDEFHRKIEEEDDPDSRTDDLEPKTLTPDQLHDQ